MPSNPATQRIATCAAIDATSPAAFPVRLGAAVAILAAAAVFTPAVVYHLQHFWLGWHDVGNYTRANYNFFEFGRFAVSSDGGDDFFVQQHFEPFFFLLCVPVRLFGTAGYVGAVTAALVVAAGYVFALARRVTGSSAVAALCASAYIVNPYTAGIAYSYHPETFGILFLLAFAYHHLVGQTWRAWLTLLLALTVKEDMWVYAVVVALLVARRDRLKETAAFVAAALCYYVVAVLYVGGSWYPTANYFNSFYELDGRPRTKLQIARELLARRGEFLPLLFTGPGLAFQLSFLCLGLFGGWRYLVTCAVMLIWLSYPGGPPRSNFSFYYSYASLLVMFVILPYALVNVRTLAARLLKDREGHRLAPVVAMGLVLAACAVMHLPGLIPEGLKDKADYRVVFSNLHHVNVPVMRSVISHLLPDDGGSVLSQFYVEPSIPQHRPLYVTTFDRGRLLDGRIRPRYVLLDLGSDDPWTPAEDTRAMVALLRRGAEYRPLYDAKGVLLYERVRRP